MTDYRLHDTQHVRSARSESLEAELAALQAMTGSAVSDLRGTLQTTLGDAYAIERELGGGGMSRVFLATDHALHRRVVVKVLSPGMAEGLSAERFAREIKVAAALQHPHIVPVLTAGESGSLPYYTMPYVEGDSLRARLLERAPGAGPVPLSEAIGILRDVALALEFAHAHGVVHRDIKPENVLLVGRTATVADFGIAKAVSAARTLAPGAVPGGTLTSIGQSIGTPAYMSPEQVAGDQVDHRTDLYAWGMVAYELLAGRHPFADKISAAQLMGVQVTEMPAPLGEGRPALPPPLTGLVMSCLAKSPDARPASATEIVEALASAVTPSGSVTAPVAMLPRPTRGRRWAVAAGVIGVLALGGSVLASRQMSVAASRAVPSLAVLPFEHEGDSTNAYFTAGITDEIRGRLTAIPELMVIARGSSNQYAGTSKTPDEIAGELGVRYLLTGTVRVVTAGGTRRVVVRPELVELTKDGRPQSRWQAPFEAEAQGVNRLQADIAERVAEAMQVAIGTATHEAIARTTTANAASYDLYLQAEAVWGSGAVRDPVTLRRAIGLYEQAVSADSSLVEGWSALAQARSFLYSNGAPSEVLGRAALDAVQRAEALGSAGTFGASARCVYHRLVARDLRRAVQACEVARRRAPNSPEAIAMLALMYGETGRYEEALREQKVALQLDPRSAAAWNTRTRLLLRLRRPAEARQAADRALALARSSLTVWLTRAAVEIAAGDLDSTRAVIAAAERELTRNRVLAYFGTYWDLGWVFSDREANDLLALGPEHFQSTGTRASVLAQMYRWRGNEARAKIFGDSAAQGMAEQLREAPNDPQRHVIRGLALAHAGRGGEALRETVRGLTLADEDRSGRMSQSNAYYHYVAARVAVLAGDRARAIEWLGEALGRRYHATPAWIRLDPSFKTLHGDPAFERLLQDAERKDALVAARQ